MAKKKLYECAGCACEFPKNEIDWEDSDDSDDIFYCLDCSDNLERAGIDAMDPEGWGYDEFGNWDGEKLGF